MGSRPTDGIAGHASPLGPAGKLIRGRARHAETSAPKIKESRLESEAAHAASASALLVAGSRKFRGSQDAIGPPRRACCKSRNLAVLGMRRLFSSVYFFEQHSFSLPFEQQRSFPAAPFGVRRRVLRSATPRGGGVERRQAHSFFLLVALARRDARACEARTCPGATGTPLGAPPWRFSAADPRWRLRQWDTGVAATARARAYCLAVGVRTSRGAVSRRSRGTPLLAPSAGRLRRRPLLSQDGNLVQ